MSWHLPVISRRLEIILKQNQYVPQTVVRQILIIFAGTQGCVDHLPIHELQRYEEELWSWFQTKHADVIKTLDEKKSFPSDLWDKKTKKGRKS